MWIITKTFNVLCIFLLLLAKSSSRYLFIFLWRPKQIAITINPTFCFYLLNSYKSKKFHFHTFFNILEFSIVSFYFFNMLLFECVMFNWFKLTELEFYSHIKSEVEIIKAPNQIVSKPGNFYGLRLEWRIKYWRSYVDPLNSWSIYVLTKKKS